MASFVFGRDRGGSRRHRPAAAVGGPGGAAARPPAEAERRGRFEPSESSDPRRSLEQALRDTAVDEQALIERRSVPTARAPRTCNHRPLDLFAFGVSRKRMEQAAQRLRVPANHARETWTTPTRW